MQYSDYALQCLLLSFITWMFQWPIAANPRNKKVVTALVSLFRVVGGLSGLAAFYFTIQAASSDWGYGWYVAIPAGMAVVFGMTVIQFFAEGMLKMSEPGSEVEE